MRHEAFDKSGQIQFRFALVALDCAPENFVAAGEPALAGDSSDINVFFNLACQPSSNISENPAL